MDDSLRNQEPPNWLDDIGKTRPPRRRDELARRVAHVVEHEAQRSTSWSVMRTREFGEDVAAMLLARFDVRLREPQAEETP